MHIIQPLWADFEAVKEHLKRWKTQLRFVSPSGCWQWINDSFEDFWVCGLYQRAKIWSPRGHEGKCVGSGIVGKQAAKRIFSQAKRQSNECILKTWIVKRHKDVNWGLVLCSHFTVDYRVGGALHHFYVVTHALCGVDQEAKSFAGSFGDSWHPERWREPDKANIREHFLLLGT